MVYLRTTLVLFLPLLLLIYGCSSTHRLERVFDARDNRPLLNLDQDSSQVETLEQEELEEPVEDVTTAEVFELETQSGLNEEQNLSLPVLSSATKTNTLENLKVDTPTQSFSKNLKLVYLHFDPLSTENEYIEVKNLDDSPANLEGYVIKYGLSESSKLTLLAHNLEPDQSIRVYFGPNPTGVGVKGGSSWVLDNDEGEVKLFAPDDLQTPLSTCNYTNIGTSPHNCDEENVLDEIVLIEGEDNELKQTIDQEYDPKQVVFIRLNYLSELEYVEILNTSTSTIDLKGFVIKDNSSSGNTVVLDSFVIAPQGVVRVFYGADKESVSGGVFGRSSTTWNNTGDTAYLFAPSDLNVPISTCEYTSANDSPHNCLFAEVPKSTPAEMDEETDVVKKDDQINVEVSGEGLLIKEVEYTSSPEYVLLFNESTGGIDLRGFVIRDASSSGNEVVLDSFVIESQGVVKVFYGASKESVSGGIFGRASITWNNTGDTAYLFAPSDLNTPISTCEYTSVNDSPHNCLFTEVPKSNTSTPAEIDEETDVIKKDDQINAEVSGEGLLIKEVDYTSSPEYVLLFNESTNDIDLKGFVIRDASSSGNTVVLDSFVIESQGAVKVFYGASKESVSGGIFGRASNTWNNTGDTAYLYAPSDLNVPISTCEYTGTSENPHSCQS